MAELSAEKVEIFERMPALKAVFKLAGPCILSSIVTLIYNMADTWFVGQTGDELQVAAVSMVFTVFFLLSAVGNLYGIGGGSLISRLLGAKQTDKVKRASAFALYAGLATAALVSVLVFIFARPILTVLGASEGTYGHCYDYVIWVVVIGGIPTVATLVMSNLLRSEGYSKQAGFGIAFGGVLNMVLDPVFIFAFHLGVKGAAMATMLSNVASTIYFLLIFRGLKGKTVLSLNIRELRADREIIGQIYLIGLPAFISTALISVSNTVSFNLLSRYSDVEIAAFGVTKKLDMIPMSVAGGVSNGVLPLIAYNYASGNYSRMKQGMKWAAVFGLAFAAVYICCAKLFNEELVRFFIDSESTVAVGAVFLSIECLCAPLMSVTNLSNSTFQAMGKGIISLIFACCQSAAVKIPMCLLMNHLLGVNGIIWANVVTESIMVIAALCTMGVIFNKLTVPKEN